MSEWSAVLAPNSWPFEWSALSCYFNCSSPPTYLVVISSIPPTCLHPHVAILEWQLSHHFSCIHIHVHLTLPCLHVPQDFEGPDMVSCVDQVLGMTINGDEGEEVIFADTGIPSPYLQVGWLLHTLLFWHQAVCMCVRACVCERKKEIKCLLMRAHRLLSLKLSLSLKLKKESVHGTPAHVNACMRCCSCSVLKEIRNQSDVFILDIFLWLTYVHSLISTALTEAHRPLLLVVKTIGADQIKVRLTTFTHRLKGWWMDGWIVERLWHTVPLSLSWQMTVLSQYITSICIECTWPQCTELYEYVQIISLKHHPKGPSALLSLSYWKVNVSQISHYSYSCRRHVAPSERQKAEQGWALKQEGIFFFLFYYFFFFKFKAEKCFKEKRWRWYIVMW